MFQWYVVNTYSGHENKVKQNLEHRIQSMGQQPRFRRVVVPTEQVIETKDGQKVQAEKRVLPGYVLVNMDLNDDAWTVVKNTPGVTGFVGAGSKPVPLSPGEVERRSNFIQESWAELKKVEWPGQNQVIQGTVVVIVACIIVGVYLWLNDQLWKEVVQKVLLK